MSHHVHGISWEALPSAIPSGSVLLFRCGFSLGVMWLGWTVMVATPPGVMMSHALMLGGGVKTPLCPSVEEWPSMGMRSLDWPAGPRWPGTCCACCGERTMWTGCCSWWGDWWALCSLSEGEAGECWPACKSEDNKNECFTKQKHQNDFLDPDACLNVWFWSRGFILHPWKLQSWSKFVVNTPLFTARTHATCNAQF